VKLQHVTDTARVVAAHRAMETSRAYALIRDPYAATLAGEKGMAIARAHAASGCGAFAVALRDHFIDELLTAALGRGDIQTVVNFGAGLDARPWRMDLPAALRWIEVDFEEMLQYKTAQLAREQPRCKLEQIHADLSIPSDRERIFHAIGDRPAAMLTEGLLMYLPAATLEALCSQAAAKSGVRWWILDVVSRDLLQRLGRRQKELDREVEQLRARDHLAGQEILDVAKASGWEPVEARIYVRDTMPIARERVLELATSFGFEEELLDANDPSGVYLFRRSS